jgi:hypothetical protein
MATKEKTKVLRKPKKLTATGPLSAVHQPQPTPY